MLVMAGMAGGMMMQQQPPPQQQQRPRMQLSSKDYVQRKVGPGQK